MAYVRTEELGRFLRSRRDRVRPCDVGLARGNRRRVPGLRREEVAVLANIGTSWYTWLEQGREVNPSESVLDSIAEALLLDREERSHFFLLGGYPDRVANPGVSTIDEDLHSLLDEVLPMPAMITDPRYTVLAYNMVERYLATDLDSLPAEDRNCAIQSFESREWADTFGANDEHKRLLVAKLRSAYAESLEDPEWGPLLERLGQYPEFRRLWDSGDVGRSSGRVKTIENPYVGTLKLRMTSMKVQENQRLTLSIYQPVDTLTRARLETLHGWIIDGTVEKERDDIVGGSATAEAAVEADRGARGHLRAVGD